MFMMFFSGIKGKALKHENTKNRGGMNEKLGTYTDTSSEKTQEGGKKN